jgi:hypothetical protein
VSAFLKELFRQVEGGLTAETCGELFVIVEELKKTKKVSEAALRPKDLTAVKDKQKKAAKSKADKRKETL